MRNRADAKKNPSPGQFSGLAFAEFVKAYPGNISSLPIVHTTRAKTFRDIIKNRIIRASPCKVFQNEFLSYMFYGRAAYRFSETNDKPGNMYADYPAAILFSPEIIAQADRIFPFDTGGYEKYSSHISSTIRMADFELPADGKSPRQLIDAFFDTNANYLLGKAKRVDFDPSDFEVDAYHAMLHHQGISEFDGRHKSVELHFKKNIVIKKGSILAVIVPESIIGGWFSAEFANLDITPLTYIPDSGRPNDYIPEIRRIALDYYKEYFQCG